MVYILNNQYVITSPARKQVPLFQHFKNISPDIRENSPPYSKPNEVQLKITIINCGFKGNISI